MGLISRWIQAYTLVSLAVILARAMKQPGSGSHSPRRSFESSSSSYHLELLSSSKPSPTGVLTPPDIESDDETRLFSARRELIRMVNCKCEPSECVRILEQYRLLPPEEKVTCRDATNARCTKRGWFGGVKCTVETHVVKTGCFGPSDGRVSMEYCTAKSRDIIRTVRRRNTRFRRQTRG